jgi:hypothetical protein
MGDDWGGGSRFFLGAENARPLTEGKKLLWYTNGRDYHIYFEGREVTREVQLQRYENNAIIMYEESM